MMKTAGRTVGGRRLVFRSNRSITSVALIERVANAAQVVPLMMAAGRAIGGRRFICRLDQRPAFSAQPVVGSRFARSRGARGYLPIA